jgi:hypothetical protein
MKKLITYSLVAIILFSGFLGFSSQLVKTASADTSYPAEVLASSAQVRFEAQVTGYDSATNKYKYKFSWLMPKGKTYSFKIDGNMYQSKVTQNAVIETPFWFSPDITYTIDIYPYANGKGAVLAKGSFKAPSVTPSTPTLTAEQEGELVGEYIVNSPKLPRKTVESREDAKQIAELGLRTKEIDYYKDIKPYLSLKSVELFDQTPLLVKEMDESNDSTDITKYTASNVKVYSGKQYASMKIVLRDNSTKEKDTLKAIFVKENGVWKIDYIQTFKSMFIEMGLLDPNL